MTLEENVLAYLDGSLGEEESAELLHMLSVSPEKRALLDEHLRLGELSALGRKPFAVPASAERALATRLPFLADEPVAVPFYMRTKTLVVAAAGVLAIVGGLWWSSTRLTAPQNASSASREAPTAALQTAPSSASDEANPGSVTATTHAVQNGETVRSGEAAHSDIAHLSNVRSSAPVTNVLKDRRSSGTSSTHDISTPAARTTDIASNGPGNTASVNELSSLISQASAKAIEIPRPSVYTPRTLHEISLGMPDRLRPLSIGASGMASGYAMPVLNSASNLSMGIDPQLSIGYDLSQWLALGLEAGLTKFGQVTSSPELITSFDGTEYTQLTYRTQVVPSGTYYARAAMDLTLDPTDDYPIRIGASGGYAFNATNDPCASLSLGITRILSEDLSLDLDAVLSGLWSSSTTAPLTSSLSGVTGISHQESNTQSSFTSVFGLRAGIRYRP